MGLFGGFAAKRCTICGKEPGLTGSITRCDRCGANVCSACWKAGPSIAILADGCRHRQALPGQLPDIRPG